MKLKNFAVAFEISLIIWVFFPLIACELLCDLLEKYIKMPRPALLIFSLGAFLIGFVIAVKFHSLSSILLVISTQFFLSALLGILIFVVAHEMNKVTGLSLFKDTILFIHYLIYSLLWIGSAILGWLIGRKACPKKHANAK